MTRRLLLSYLSITAFVLLILEIPLALTYEHSERDRLDGRCRTRRARARRRASRAPWRAGHRRTCSSSPDEYQQTVGGRVVDRRTSEGQSVADSGSDHRRATSRTRPGARGRARHGQRRVRDPPLGHARPVACCTSRCRSRRRARCSVRCASRSRRPSSTRGCTATGSRSPRSVASSWSRSPAWASCWRVR